MKKSAVVILSIVALILITGSVAVWVILLPRYNEIKDQNPEKTVFQNLQDTISTQNSSEDETDQGGPEEEPDLSLVPGTYKLDQTVDGDFASESMTDIFHTVINIIVNDDLTLTGDFLETGHTESTLVPDIIDSNETFTFSGKINTEGVSEFQVSYVKTVDNNTVEPLHRENTLNADIEIVYKDGKLEFTKTHTSNGKVMATDTYVLDRV